MAPRAGLEPATDRLTADCSTTELPRNTIVLIIKKITKNKIKQDEIIAMNYFCRRTYEKQGRDRFVDMFLIDKQEAIITKSKGKQDKDYFDIDKEKRQMLRTLMYIDRNKEHISDYEKSLKYGVTENGVLCKTKCKSSMCSAFGCGDKEDTCINVYGKKEKCYFPKDNRKAKKSRKKKRRKKKIDLNICKRNIEQYVVR